MATIDIDKPRYPQTTYLGRLWHFIEITDVRNLLITDKTLRDSQQLIQDYKAGKVRDVPEEDLWRAKTYVSASIHPDTNEKIFLPFRMASFVPTNLAVVAGLLLSNPTSIGATIFWQVANQSINVAFNFANANKTSPMSLTETAVAYAGAVSSSCFVAVGLGQLVKKASAPDAKGWFARPFVRNSLAKVIPFTAVAIAGTVNVFLMRQKELQEGIEVRDKNNDPVGKSTSAGLTAISQVAVSRIATAFPCLVLPPLVYSQLERTSWLRRNPRLAIPINIGLIAASLMSALPCAIALFPQYAEVPVTSLEAKFHNLKDRNGDPIEKVYYNKGL